jgi:hypothetical protein
LQAQEAQISRAHGNRSKPALGSRGRSVHATILMNKPVVLNKNSFTPKIFVRKAGCVCLATWSDD